MPLVNSRSAGFSALHLGEDCFLRALTMASLSSHAWEHRTLRVSLLSGPRAYLSETHAHATWFRSHLHSKTQGVAMLTSIVGLPNLATSGSRASVVGDVPVVTWMDESGCSEVVG